MTLYGECRSGEERRRRGEEPGFARVVGKPANLRIYHYYLVPPPKQTSSSPPYNLSSKAQASAKTNHTQPALAVLKSPTRGDTLTKYGVPLLSFSSSLFPSLFRLLWRKECYAVIRYNNEYRRYSFTWITANVFEYSLIPVYPSA